jgi:hypothetical protein
MARWRRGEAEMEQLIRRRELEHVTGAAADGAPLLAQVHKTAATAAGLVQADAHSSYVLERPAIGDNLSRLVVGRVSHR